MYTYTQLEKEWREDNIYAPIGHTAFPGIVVIEWIVLSIVYTPNSISGNIVLPELFNNCFTAHLREPLIVLYAANVIGVAGNADLKMLQVRNGFNELPQFTCLIPINIVAATTKVD